MNALPRIEQFQKIKLRYDNTADENSGLICTARIFEEYPVIGLRKESWTSGNARLFFSVWVDKDSATTNRVHFNIHAFKLREFKGHVITSRDFATAFRKLFKSLSHDWPHVSVDHGPLNLMQGWIALNTETFEDDVLSLLTRFERISPTIDRLLEERIAPVRRHLH